MRTKVNHYRTNGNTHFGVSLAVLFFLLLAVELCQGQEAPANGGDWTGWLSIATNQVDVAAVRTYDRVQIGPVLTWVDQDTIPNGDGFGGGVIVTVDLLKDAKLSVLDVEIPIQWFLGGKAEVMWFQSSKDLDPAPSLLTGFRFGGPQAGIAIVYERALTDDLWSPLASRSDTDILSFMPYWQF